MTNAVSSSIQPLPTATPQTSMISEAPVGLPFVAGGEAQTQAPVAGAASDPYLNASIVDAAIAEATGTSVVGGGAPAESVDPRNGIPAFVQRFLDAGAGAGAHEQQLNQGPPSKQSGAPQQAVQQGWAWISCPPRKPAPATPAGPPPGKGDPPPAKSDPVAPAPPVQQKGGGTYTVVKGDNLSQIASRHGITWQQLYWNNREQIKHPDLIHPGQVLQIPSCDLEVPPFSYTPMFKPGHKSPGAPPKQQTPPQGPPPKQDAPPSKGETPPGKVETPPGKPDATKPVPAEPTPTPTPDKPSSTPPGTNPGTDGKLPEAPPIPDTSGNLPPALPRV